MARRRNDKAIKLSQRERPERLYAKNESQGYALAAIDDGDVIFLEGSAGAGKTFLATIRACEYLYEGKVDRVILTRPNVETGKPLGALPGTLEEKIDPYMEAMKYCIISRFGKGWTQSQISNGNIVCEALNLVQGKTFDNSIIIVDEAEHLTIREVYIILTRLGKYSKIILCGDNFQKFSKGENGFEDAIKRLSRIDRIYTVSFTSDDIVRAPIVKEIVKAYEV